jgi:hypothetical protein
LGLWNIRNKTRTRIAKIATLIMLRILEVEDFFGESMGVFLGWIVAGNFGFGELEGEDPG